jgi:hypothetical protein
MLAKEIEEVHIRHAVEESPVRTQALPVSGGHCCGIPRTTGNAEADGRRDAERVERLDDANLEDAPRGPASEQKPELRPGF